MSNKLKCLISAGPTREWIDPIRFISNPSSGKMGYAIAGEAKKRGYLVNLVSGPVHLGPIEGISTHFVETADQMSEKMDYFFDDADIIIMCAAVCDHRPNIIRKQKIKKKLFPRKLEMIENQDIIKKLSKKKRTEQILVGFAAETENLIQNAKQKLKDKRLDWIAMNDVSNSGCGFNSDKNKITMFSSSGKKVNLGESSKENLAAKIFDLVLK